MPNPEQPSIDLQTRWFPGGAQGNDGEVFCDGSQYLMAVRCCHSPERKKQLSRKYAEQEWWDFCVVTARCDDETPAYFEGDDWGWDWSDVEWFLPLSNIDLPVPTGGTEGN